MPTQYQSNRLTYRPIIAEDTDMVLRWRNSEHVVNNFIYRSEVTRENHLNWLKTKVETGSVRQFIVLETSTGIPFGSVYLKDINPDDKSAEYGIFIGEKDKQNLGYGSEIAKWMVDYFFNTMGYDKLILRVLARNKEAISTYQKAGFVVDEKLTTTIEIEGTKETLLFMHVNS